MHTRLMLALPFALTLFVACGNGDGSPTGSAPDPVGEAPAAGATDSPAVDTGPTAGGGAIPAPGEALGPALSDLPRFTIQPFEGSPLSVETFPQDQIVSGGPPRDGIPALNNPPSVAASAATLVGDDDLVLGVVIDGDARAYPHAIGWWHEIVNDRIGDRGISVTFCPLTSTGMVFDATAEDGQQFELGVSGLLYNNNLIIYDRRDNATLYPQIYTAGIEGSHRGEALTLLPVLETTWRTWKALHPNTRVIESGTYPQSRYAVYPYGDYRTNDNYLLFRLQPSLADNASPYAGSFGTKDMVMGLRLNGAARAYPFKELGQQAVVNDALGDIEVVVAYDRDSQMAVPFARQVADQILTFQLREGGFPFQLRDLETGSIWDLTGLAIDGPLSGTRLTQVPAHNAFWFAWVTFWPETDVYLP